MHRIALLLVLACSLLACRNGGLIDTPPSDQDPPHDPPPTTGHLVAHWPLDGNGDDAVGDADGIVEGARPAIDRFGTHNGAMELDGSDDAIVIESSRLPPVLPRHGLTISAWVHPRVRKTQVVVQLSSSPNPPWGLGFSQTGDAVFEIGTHWFQQLRMMAYPVGRWYHVAGTWDGERASLYVDGVLAHTAPLGGILPDDRNPILIGTRTHQWSDSFNGRIDDIRLYDYALSHGEISRLAQH